MAHSDLIDHLLGASSEEIGQRPYTTSKSAEEVDKTIAYEMERLERKALEEDSRRCDRAATWKPSHG